MSCGYSCARWPSPLASVLRCIALPEAVTDCSLNSLQLKLIKIGARILRHARAISFQPAEAAVTGPMVRDMFAAIRQPRAPPSSTWPRSRTKPNESAKTAPSEVLNSVVAKPGRCVLKA
jgi:hypothetical protein